MKNRHTVVEALRALEGKRVELVEMKDPYTKLKPGTKGTVAFVDDMGTLHVDWDTGSKLGLVHGEDDYRVIK
ncbi:hypothetical protein M3_0183 [Lysinibacillus phage vB_LfM_LysYB1]|nr:hypothetical protein M3_0183 [Lysinibacillus phage vB_LfM_LysYB1]WAB25305.1 hypothetical protein M5_0127 [Lysinibacillus phage vB_LfM_LysYB2]